MSRLRKEGERAVLHGGIPFPEAKQATQRKRALLQAAPSFFGIYSMLFRLSTMSIFLSFQNMRKLTITANSRVSSMLQT